MRRNTAHVWNYLRLILALKFAGKYIKNINKNVIILRANWFQETQDFNTKNNSSCSF